MVQVPAAENETETKLAEMKKQKDSLSCQIKCGSYFFIVAGIIGLIQSAHCYMSSKKWARFIVEHKKLPWGCHKLQEHHPAPPPPSEEPEFMSRDEFLLIDLFKNIGILSFMIFFSVLAVGCMSKKVAYWQSKWCTGWLIRKIMFAFLVFTFAYLMSKHQGNEFMGIFMDLADEDTKLMMAEKHKHRIGMCPVMIVFFIVKLVNLYKLKTFHHTLEKISMLEEHKKEIEKKDQILQAVQQMQQ